MSKIKFQSLINQLKITGIKITPEFKFCPTRKFRADYMLEYKGRQILIEYEGLFATKSRHITVTGFSKDCQKYNIATKLGFPILRYTAMNYKEITPDTLEIFKL